MRKCTTVVYLVAQSAFQLLQINMHVRTDLGATPNSSSSPGLSIHGHTMNVQSHTHSHAEHMHTRSHVTAVPWCVCVCVLSTVIFSSIVLSLPLTTTQSFIRLIFFPSLFILSSVVSLKGVALINYSGLAFRNLCPCEQRTLI